MKNRPRCNVSDHALLRYMERVKKIDVEALRAEVARLGDFAVEHGASATIRNGYRYVVVDAKVVTVLPKRPARGSRGRK